MLQPRQGLPPDVERLWDELILSLDGVDRARCLAIASFIIIIYEYFLTLDDEVRSNFGHIP